AAIGPGEQVLPEEHHQDRDGEHRHARRSSRPPVPSVQKTTGGKPCGRCARVVRGRRTRPLPRNERGTVIEVEHLTKRYGPRTAVHDVSFRVDKGEIVGFLGPNGAGKSTTLRMLTGFLAPSGGSIRIDGVDALTSPIEAKKRIGYMPEACPLYPEMRVREYLRYRAELKRVPGRKIRERVE